MISIIIPSKNEPYLQKTVDDIFRHAEGDIEILIGLDGDSQEVVSPGDKYPVAICKMSQPIGQRAMMNYLAKQAKGEYIMKCDAHVSFGQGFDRILLEDIQDNQIVAPYLLVLDAENWKVRPDKKTSSYVFDSQLVMHYGIENKEPINETMCLQGSCFMTRTENYWDWNLCDESLGSWGGQGSELGIKAYLNGGVCVTNKKTYYGHLFRHFEEDFPYKRSQAEIDASHQAVVKTLRTPAIKGLIEKYNFPVDWSDNLHVLDSGMV